MKEDDKKIKKIDEFFVWDDSRFDYNDDTDLGISLEQALELDEISRNKIREKLGPWKPNTSGRKVCSMEMYRKIMLNKLNKGTLTSTFEEINKQHNEFYGCDFEPKF